MGVVLKGLASINEELAKRPAAGGSFEDREPAKWVTLKGGESVKLVFLQELDEGSPNYSAKNGTGLFSLQHSNPDNWKKTAACTSDEGECYGCQRGWKQKIVLYVNALVDNGNDKPFVAIWSRGLGKGSVAQDLLNMAADEDFNNSITDKAMKFVRTGKTKDDTTYSLSVLPKPHDYDVESYDLFDLEQYVFTVSYDRQEAYYTDGVTASEPPARPSSTSSGIDAEWG